MDYLIRFAQSHDSFRLAEIEAVVSQINEVYARGEDGLDVKSVLKSGVEVGLSVDVEVLEYRRESPFCVVRFHVRRRRRSKLGRGDDRGEGAGGRGKRSDGRGGDGMEQGLDGQKNLNARERREELEMNETSTGQGDGTCAGKREKDGEQEQDEVDEEDEITDQRVLEDIARAFITRSIQAKAIYELWGSSPPSLCVPRVSPAFIKPKQAAINSEPAIIDPRPAIINSNPADSLTTSYDSPTNQSNGDHPTSQSSHIQTHTPTSTHTSTPTPAHTQTSPSPSSFPSTTTTTCTYKSLHASVHQTRRLWPQYKNVLFKFTIDTFKGKRTEPEKMAIINGFRYLGFEGKIDLKLKEGDGEEWCVFEEYGVPSRLLGDELDNEGVEREDAGKREDAGEEKDAADRTQTSKQTQTVKQENEKEKDDEEIESGIAPARQPIRLYLGRKIGVSHRHLIEKHDLKKRPYISTTSMDAELALMTANLALAAPGKVFIDPFCGTGGFMVAAAELGAYVMGCDIDGRSYRGKKGKGVEGGAGRNFEKYALQGLFMDCFTADLVNTPLVVERRWLDGIIADPPYGVREGLKVLGSRKSAEPGSGEGEVAAAKQPAVIDGVLAHTLPGFVAPKKPYSFVRMLDDILDIAARTLVDGGRLAFWMPSANENDLGDEEVTTIPRHALMELKHECVQRFNKWSRRLLVYERVPGKPDEGIGELANGVHNLTFSGSRADDLNPFRRRYFQAFAERPNG